jgi:UDPglucose--hexose-1-phosphate uridylyltransferase
MSRSPEWRQDPLTERLVLISPERAERPMKSAGVCPFCEGHESETPPEVLAYREPGSTPNGPGWRVRVVPNRFAAVRLDAGTDWHGSVGTDFQSVQHELDAKDRLEVCPHGSAPGIGVAEVFIECPYHEMTFCNLSREQMADVFRAWRDRLRFWHDDGRVAFVQIFRNEGSAAGASLDHCHSQLIGIPFVPHSVVEEVNHLATLRGFAGYCPLCRWVESGRNDERFVLESSRFAAFGPPAPRFPGETWLMPKFHIHAFDALGDDKLLEMADVVRDLLARIDQVFDAPAFNLVMKLPPFPLNDAYHWRLEILPRVTRIAGWELGTGIFINTMFPEDAAKLLRDAR